VILAHGSELMPTRSSWRRGVWNLLLRRVCEAADVVVANSAYTRDLVLRVAPKATVVAVPLGVDHNRFTPRGRETAGQRFGVEGKIVICSVSRLQAHKGHETVLKALSGVPCAIRQRFVYLVAGRGPHERALRDEAESLGISAQIHWLGFVPEEDLPDLYRTSDLFVLCTRESAKQQEVEGFGLAFLEAQACGTPVVGAHTGGIPEAVREGEGGWLIGQDDVDALRSILLRLANHPDEFREAGLIARRRVERECTWEHYMQRFSDALKAGGIRIG
jgi:phosphatidylinositol alpha-1,6-mannosyltransferase